jgi:hypothetical protein
VGPLPPATTRCNCQALLASFECFYSKYRWQVARDFLPIFTFIQAREYRTTVCAAARLGPIETAAVNGNAAADVTAGTER